MEKWVTVAEYAKKVGKARSQIYNDIVWKRISPDRVRKKKITKERVEIKVD